jgi:segregation and condensation protein B
LSAPSLETLAVVAYRQPVVRAEIEDIRGVACGEILRQLMERDLVRVSGRSEELGRPYLYSTTKKFLQSFGLRGLDELPRAEAFRKAISESLSGDSDISTENGDETVAVVFEKDQLIEEIEGEKVQRPAKKAGSKKRAGPPQAIDDDDEWGDEDLDGDEEWEDGDDDEDLDDDDDEEFEYEYEGDDDDEDWEEVDDEDVGDFEDEEDLAADEDDEEEWD